MITWRYYCFLCFPSHGSRCVFHSRAHSRVDMTKIRTKQADEDKDEDGEGGFFPSLSKMIFEHSNRLGLIVSGTNPERGKRLWGLLSLLACVCAFEWEEFFCNIFIISKDEKWLTSWPGGVLTRLPMTYE